MRTRVPGRPQLWCRRTPTPEPLPQFAPTVFDGRPGDNQKPSLVILSLTGFSYGRFQATLHKLRHDARLILVTDEEELSRVVTHESNQNSLAGIIIADAEIIHPERRALAGAVASLLHDTEAEWAVIFAFDFATQAWRNRQMFARFTKRHFPTLRWEIGAMMAVKHRMVLRRRVLRKMGPRVYRKKYRMRGAILLRVKQADKVVVVENEDGRVEAIMPDRTFSSSTREEPDTPSTCPGSGGEEEVFDCQMGVVDDFEEDEIRGVVDGDEGNGGRPQRRSEYWTGMDVGDEDLQTPSYSDFPSSSNSSSSDEDMLGTVSVNEDEQSDIDDDIEDGIEEGDVDDHHHSPSHRSQDIDNDTDHCNEKNNDYNADWVPSDDERTTENTRRRCTIALHEFKNWRQNEETGKDEMICSYLGFVGHAEDNRSLASIILGMCSIAPSQ